MENNLLQATPKSHWSHADSFGDGAREYIKSFVHKSYEIGYHTHSFYELNLILRGSGFHYIEGQRRTASRGCIFLIPPGIRHGYQKHSEDFDVYHMLIHRDFLDVYLQEFSKTIGFSLLFEIEPYFRTRDSENMFLTLSEEEMVVIRSDIAAIDACEGLADVELYQNAIAKKLLAQLCLYFTKRQELITSTSATSKELGAITSTLHYIHQNYGEHLPITLLAARINLSRSTFLRHFEKICGCTPHQYLHRYRLERAKEYLQRKDRSLTEIATLCGFYDASHLRKALKKE